MLIVSVGVSPNSNKIHIAYVYENATNICLIKLRPRSTFYLVVGITDVVWRSDAMCCNENVWCPLFWSADYEILEWVCQFYSLLSALLCSFIPFISICLANVFWLIHTSGFLASAREWMRMENLFNYNSFLKKTTTRSSGGGKKWELSGSETESTIRYYDVSFEQRKHTRNDKYIIKCLHIAGDVDLTRAKRKVHVNFASYRTR